MSHRITISFLMAALILVPSMIKADDIVPLSYPTRVAVMLLADSISAETGVSPFQVKSVLKAESGYNPAAVGDHGLAHGPAQFHQATFNQYEALYFTATNQHLNYDSAQDQITLMAWMWKTYPSSKLQWSTYRKLFTAGAQGKVVH